MGIFDIFKNDTSKKNRFDFKINVTSEDGDIPSMESIPENMQEAIFLFSVNDGESIRDSNDLYARYLLHECGISNPIEFHRKMIEDGYLEKGTIHQILKKLSIVELKKILKGNGLLQSGKKEILVQRIIQDVPETTLKNISDLNNGYFISEKGKVFYEENKIFVEIHRHKNWGINHLDYQDFQEKIINNSSFYDFALWTLNSKLSLYLRQGEWGMARNMHFFISELFCEEHQYENSLFNLLVVLLYDINGVNNMHMLNLHPEFYSKKGLIENFAQESLAPGIIKRIHKLQIFFKMEILDHVYEAPIPMISICSKDIFLEILNKIFNNSLDESLYEYENDFKDAFRLFIEIL